MLNFRAAVKALFRGAKWRSEDDDDHDLDWNLTQDTPSGVKLTRRKAYSVSSWFRAINLLSSTVAKTPIDVLDVQNGVNIPDPLHSLSLLLSGHGQPNDETLRFHFVQTLTAHAIGHGGGFAYIYRDKGGRPIELLQLRPDRTYPIREGGKLLFMTTIGGDYGTQGVEMRKLLAENVLHIHGLGYDGLTGYSLLQLAARALGSAVAKEEFGSRYFKNSASPSVIIKTPKKLTPQAFNNLSKSWGKLRTGLDNSHKTAILEEGAEVQQFSHNAADAQLIEAMDRDPVLVSNFTGVPPHLLGVKGYNSYNSLEIQSQDLLDYAVDPLFIPWEQELASKCLAEREKKNYSRVVQFRRRELIRVDYAKRLAGHRTALGGHPFKEINEVRKEEGLQAVDGYDFIPSPLNMSQGPADPAPDPQTNPDGTPIDPQQNSDQASKAVRQLVEQTAKRMASRLHGAADRKGSAPAADHRSVLVEAFAPLCVVSRAKATGEAVADELLRSIETAAKESRLSEWLETTPARVTDAICGSLK